MILQSLLDAALLEMTTPDKSRSSKQRYRLRTLGPALMEAWEQPR